MAKLQNTILCACGEHYVASYLSGMGAVVALTRAGIPATDLIMTSEKGGRSVSLQVKTGRAYNRVTHKKDPTKDYWVWRVGTKAMEQSSEYHWYVFVSVVDWPQSQESPVLFFVPSALVAKTLREQPSSQQDWFWMPDAESQQYRGEEGYKKLAKCLAS